MGREIGGGRRRWNVVKSANTYKKLLQRGKNSLGSPVLKIRLEIPWLNFCEVDLGAGLGQMRSVIGY